MFFKYVYLTDFCTLIMSFFYKDSNYYNSLYCVRLSLLLDTIDITFIYLF